MKKEKAVFYPLRDYGIIGDCHTSALVSKEGTIDWYCPGRFDSPSVFCRILDSKKGGFLSVAPEKEFTSVHSYAGDTNILKNTFETSDSKVCINYFMPVRKTGTPRTGYDLRTSKRIMLHIEGLQFSTKLILKFHPAFNFGRNKTTLEKINGFGLIASDEVQYLSLYCSLQELVFYTFNEHLQAEFTIRQGQECWLVLNNSSEKEIALKKISDLQCRQQLEETKEYWNDWVKDCSYKGIYEKQVVRSALVMKLLTYEPTGAIVASPTTSLPEEAGGSRNWDYRYSWLRDSSLILSALIGTGYDDEAADFFEWLEETCKKDLGHELQILYRINGKREITETILEHLEGYRKSRPVRTGNNAILQFHLSAYGEIITAAFLYYKSGIGKGRKKPGFKTQEKSLKHVWPFLFHIIDTAEKRWHEPDNGIWEVRSEKQHFLYSKVMCWAAMDRGIRLAEEFSLNAPLDQWKTTRFFIKQKVLSEGYNKHIGSFVQSLGGSIPDASVLLLPKLGFIPPSDFRMQSTIEMLKKQLNSHGLLYRYHSKDGLSGEESAFTLCTFWMIDCLCLSGQLEKAQDMFDNILSRASDLGLFPEEINPFNGEFLGNFPYMYVHMSVINSALNLAKALKYGAETSAETEYERTVKSKTAVKDGFGSTLQAAHSVK